MPWICNIVTGCHHMKLCYIVEVDTDTPEQCPCKHIQSMDQRDPHYQCLEWTS